MARLIHALQPILDDPASAIVLGLVVSPICLFFVSVVKNMLGYDDSLDVFGVHCIGGITGAIATGILVNPALGGAGIVDYTQNGAAVYPGLVPQVISQLWGVGTTIVWSAIGSLIVFGLAASSFAIPGLLGGRRLKMVATVVYDEYLIELNWPLGAALSFILLAVVLVLLAAASPVLRRAR